MAHGTITAGTAAHANNAAVTPTNPTQGSGDTLLCWAVIRSSTGTLAVTGTGWTDADGITNPITLQGSARLYLFQNETDGAGNPTVTPSGGAAGVTVSAGVLNLHGRDKAQNFTLGTVSLNATTSTTVLFAQNSSSIDNGNAIIAIGHKLDDWSVAPGTLAGQTAGLTWAQLHRESTTLGNDHSIAVDYAINSTGSAYTAGTGASMTGTWSASAQSAGVYLESVGGPNTFTYSGSGGVTLAGSATLSKAKAVSGSGGLSLAGSAALLKCKAFAASGGLQLAGSATLAKARAFTPSGGLSLAGSAALAKGKVPAPAGGIVLSGTAATILTAPAVYAYAGTGGMVTGGRAFIEWVFNPRFWEPPFKYRPARTARRR